ncbi:MAG: oligoribonuclease [Acidimicrobiia bacterium]|nr:oligoribonuclease [Acidimicrobiia bacterium]
MDQPLVWIDLEMTGLDPDNDVILEIACIVTDGNLSEIVEGPNLILNATAEQLDGMVEIVTEMHTKSGLVEEVPHSTMTVAQAERLVLEFIAKHVPGPGLAPLAGNSVHADRAFLRRFMPALNDFLHYRIVDVSTIKELARRWFPQAIENAPKKHGDHRALADVRESIQELRYFREAVFRPPATRPETEFPS